MLLAGIAILAFAGNSVIARYALAAGGIDAATFSLVRLGAGAIVLAPLLLRGTGRWSLSGGISLFVYVAMFSFAYVDLPTATGALILFTVVQATVVLAGMLRGEPMRLLGWAGLLQQGAPPLHRRKITPNPRKIEQKSQKTPQKTANYAHFSTLPLRQGYEVVK